MTIFTVFIVCVSMATGNSSVCVVFIGRFGELECDRTIVSGVNGSRNGTFASPTFENREGHVRQCRYTFIAGPGERVHLAFHVFNLRGTPPE